MAYNVYPVMRGLSFPILRRPVTSTLIETASGGQEYRSKLWTNPLHEFELTYDYFSPTDLANLLGFWMQQNGPFTPFNFDHLNDDTVSSALAFATTDGVTSTWPVTHSYGGLASEPVGQINTITSLLSDSVAQPLAGLSAPGAATLSQVASGSLAAATYFVKVTWLNQWGETLPSTEQSLAVSLNNVLKVTQPASPPATAKYWQVYVSTTTGTEQLQTTAVKLPIATTSWQEPNTGLAGSGAVPSSNTTTWAISAAGNGVTFPAVPETGHILSWTGTFYYLCRFVDDNTDFSQFANNMFENKKVKLRTVR